MNGNDPGRDRNEVPTPSDDRCDEGPRRAARAHGPELSHRIARDLLWLADFAGILGELPDLDTPAIRPSSPS